jgi:hypothetical protein
MSQKVFSIRSKKRTPLNACHCIGILHEVAGLSQYSEVEVWVYLRYEVPFLSKLFR